jgi:hypothetical protein
VVVAAAKQMKEAALLYKIQRITSAHMKKSKHLLPGK